MRELTGVLAALLLVFGLAACGASGGDDEADSTTTTDGSPSGGGDGDEADYVEAIASGLARNSSDEGELEVTAEQADCIAPEWVSIIGVDSFADAGASPADVADPDFAIPSLSLDVDQGLEMVDAFDTCDVDVYAQFLDVLSADLDDKQSACLEGELDQDRARQFLAEALTQEDLPSDLEATFEEIDKTCSLSEG